MSENTQPEAAQAAPAESAEKNGGIIRITRTELVWPGKYDEQGNRRELPRASLPFQVIETINESRATRETEKARGKTLFDFYAGNEGDTFEAGWKNKLIWGDNALVMSSLLEKFAGKVDLIYIDPPFATGSDFSFSTQIGEEDLEVAKEQSAIEEKAYRDTWGSGLDSYLSMMEQRLLLIRDLLSEEGSLFVHCDWHVNAAMRLLLEDVFGSDQFLSEIIWKRKDSNKAGTTLSVVTDTILHFSKSENYTWNQIYIPYSEERIAGAYRNTDEKGRQYALADLMAPGDRKGTKADYEWKGVRPRPGRHWAYTLEKMKQLEVDGRIFWNSNGIPKLKMFLDESKGAPLGNLWTDIFMLKGGTEAVDYATQKPEGLLDRILSMASKPGGLVADFFCGSGTTLAVAEKQGRRWIGCDLGRYAIHKTRKRLLEIEGCKPFEVLNLGKYERQFWQGVTFGTNGKNITEKAIYEYLAFILRLYGAQPVSGMAHLHGKKGRAMVHIGAVDAPVTIDEINGALSECAQVKQTELHVLGWEWEMGLYDLMVDEAKKQGMKLLLLNIPREVMEQQAVEKGDIRFFELAYLEVDLKKSKKLTVSVKLKDFVIPNTDLVPEEIRSKVKKWSDYIDYWAVDWNFQNDTFMQGWVTYRTPKDRSLPLESDNHAYEKAGRYRVLVKVVDIFGNDTTQAFDVEVK